LPRRAPRRNRRGQCWPSLRPSVVVVMCASLPNQSRRGLLAISREAGVGAARMRAARTPVGAEAVRYQTEGAIESRPSCVGQRGVVLLQAALWTAMFFVLAQRSCKRGVTSAVWWWGRTWVVGARVGWSSGLVTGRWCRVAAGLEVGGKRRRWVVVLERITVL
jgi:hypothetical protein